MTKLLLPCISVSAKFNLPDCEHAATQADLQQDQEG